ncbi:hypothetical protein V1478_007763, partial [Vespula squamosa]
SLVPVPDLRVSTVLLPRRGNNSGNTNGNGNGNDNDNDNGNGNGRTESIMYSHARVLGTRDTSNECPSVERSTALMRTLMDGNNERYKERNAKGVIAKWSNSTTTTTTITSITTTISS